MSRNAFVTGGTGFIGINLIKSLLESGWNVTALHRPSSDLTYLGRLPVCLQEGSITDKLSLERAMPDDTDVVFHLAGDTNLWSKHNERQTRINVEGTRNILEICSANRIGSFIYTSSASSWGDMANKDVTEDLPPLGGESWVNYERTKWAAEQEVLKYTEQDMKVVILNPTTVTGPHDSNNWGRLFFALKNNQLPAIPDGVISVTHVREVARAHIAAVDRGRDGHKYILSGEDCTFKRFISEIARISGIHTTPGVIPDFLLKSHAYFQSFLSLFTGREPDITPELVKIMTRKNISYSSKKAISELDYKITPMEESVRDCYNWLTKEGFL